MRCRPCEQTKGSTDSENRRWQTRPCSRVWLLHCSQSKAVTMFCARTHNHWVYIWINRFIAAMVVALTWIHREKECSWSPVCGHGMQRQQFYQWIWSFAVKKDSPFVQFGCKESCLSHWKWKLLRQHATCNMQLPPGRLLMSLRILGLRFLAISLPPVVTYKYNTRNKEQTGGSHKY